MPSESPEQPEVHVFRMGEGGGNLADSAAGTPGNQTHNLPAVVLSRFQRLLDSLCDSISVCKSGGRRRGRHRGRNGKNLIAHHHATPTLVRKLQHGRSSTATKHPGKTTNHTFVVKRGTWNGKPCPDIGKESHAAP